MDELLLYCKIPFCMMKWDSIQNVSCREVLVGRWLHTRARDNRDRCALLTSDQLLFRPIWRLDIKNYIFLKSILVYINRVKRESKIACLIFCLILCINYMNKIVYYLEPLLHGQFCERYAFYNKQMPHNVVYIFSNFHNFRIQLCRFLRLLRL